MRALLPDNQYNDKTIVSVTESASLSDYAFLTLIIKSIRISQGQKNIQNLFGAIILHLLKRIH